MHVRDLSLGYLYRHERARAVHQRNLSPEQTQDRELFSEEDSSLYFTYSGGCNKLEVNDLNYEVTASSVVLLRLSKAFQALRVCVRVCVRPGGHGGSDSLV